MSNTWFVDLNGGDDLNTGDSFAQRVKTLSMASTLALPGDTVRVMGTAASSWGDATWTKGSPLVSLQYATNQLLYSDGAWVAEANVTASAVSSAPSPKEGIDSSELACDAIFTTGKVAHWETGTLDLSGYQQITFWIQSTVALPSGALSVDLCSDTSGDTIVNTLILNVALNAGSWTAVTIDNGAALGSSIESIRLTANSSLESTTIYIDNVNACTAPSAGDCLTLNTLISPDLGPTAYHIQSINGTTVYIDGQATTAAGLAKGYQGEDDTNLLVKFQPTHASIGTSDTDYAQNFSVGGVPGDPIFIVGGWDSTDMSTQDGVTFIDRLDWIGAGIDLASIDGNINLVNFYFARCSYPIGLVADAAGYVLNQVNCAGTGPLSNMPIHGTVLYICNFLNSSGTSAMVDIPQTENYHNELSNWFIYNSKFLGCTVGGIKVSPSIGSPGVMITGSVASGNDGTGFDIQSVCDKFFDNTAEANGGPGFNFEGINGGVGYSLVARGNATGEVQVKNSNIEIFGLDTDTPGGSTVPQLYFPTGAQGQAAVNNWIQYTGLSPAAVLTSLGDPSNGLTAGNFVSSQKEGGAPAENSIYTDYGTVTTAGVVGQPGSGIAWKLSPNSNVYAGSPLRLNVGKIVCPANVLTTVTYWAKLSADGPTAQFKVFGGRYAGVGSPGSDIVSSLVTGDTYAEYSVAFTPTEECVVDVFFEVWNSSTESATVSGPVVVNQ